MINKKGNKKYVQPLCSRSYSLCCQKLLNGAMPVPGPTRIQGAWLSLGSWNDGALERCSRQNIIY